MRVARSLTPENAGDAVGTRTAPLIIHVIYRLDVGGLENGLVNLINRISPQRFRHAIVCLTESSPFSRRLTRDDVSVYALNKPPGNSPVMHLKLWRLFMRLRPDVVHTRNLGPLEAVVAAALAGVPVRIHGEHGHDVGDLGGSNRKYQWVRRALKPLVHRYIALSRDLERYLREKIRVPASRIVQLYNGVDTEVFYPARAGREALPHANFAGPGQFVIGTVGRMQAVKDPVTLARAFVLLLRMVPDGARRLRLVMVGDGPLGEQVRSVLNEAGVMDLVWLAGSRDDVPGIMRGLDLFVLPSISEGVSNTLLEAMASGLPIVATRVGGNPELVVEDVTGTLVPHDDAEHMALAMRAYVDSAELCTRQGVAARQTVEHKFSMEAMVSAYMSVYDQLLVGKRLRG